MEFKRKTSVPLNFELFFFPFSPVIRWSNKRCYFFLEALLWDVRLLFHCCSNIFLICSHNCFVEVDAFDQIRSLDLDWGFHLVWVKCPFVIQGKNALWDLEMEEEGAVVCSAGGSGLPSRRSYSHFATPSMWAEIGNSRVQHKNG